MPRTKVLIAVKTYPVLSRTYEEVVCTAGLREDGSWVRIYPVPFRKFDEYERYKKFEWIEIDLIRNRKDRRSESYRPQSAIKKISQVGIDNSWQERRIHVLEKGTVYTNLDTLIQENKTGSLSLATFKPTEVIDVTVEPTERDWDPKALEDIAERNKQEKLFDDEPNRFKLVKKLPYKFRYKFADDAGKISNLMIEDWEIGALYWNLMGSHNDEAVATEKVIQKYRKALVVNRDLHFFLGTTLTWDGRAPNPFMIIGVFSPPEIRQAELF